MTLRTALPRRYTRKAAWSALGATLVSMFGASGCTSFSAETKDVIARPPFALGDVSGATSFVGTVKELVPAGSYLYVAIGMEDGSYRWVATLGKPLRVGATVRVHAYAERKDFVSKRTGRTFARLIFGQVIDLSPSLGRKS